MVEVGKWSRCGCGAARVVKAGCSGGIVGEKKEKKSTRGQLEPRGQVNASYFLQPRTLEEMKVRYRLEISANVVVGAAMCSLSQILASY